MIVAVYGPTAVNKMVVFAWIKINLDTFVVEIATQCRLSSDARPFSSGPEYLSTMNVGLLES